MEVNYYEFCKKIAEDFGIELHKRQKYYFEYFPTKNGKKKINATYDSVIVDRLGNEHPYMVNSGQRNEEKLIDFDYIYTETLKCLDEIIKETGVKMGIKKVKICEGGGWYSWGNRYSYKDIYCEF